MTLTIRLAVVAGLLTAVGAVTAHAETVAERANGKFKCPGNSVKHDWMLISTSGDPLYCKLSVTSKNKINGKCFDADDPKLKMKASGSMKVDSKCVVTGSFNLDAGDGELAKASIEANMTKSQTTIIGIVVNSEKPDKGRFGTITAIRMQ